MTLLDQMCVAGKRYFDQNSVLHKATEKKESTKCILNRVASGKPAKQRYHIFIAVL